MKAGAPMTADPRFTTTAVRSTCPYCGVGCGVLLARDDAGGLTVRGDPDHPANRGALCSKGAALAETVGLGGRLLAPRVGGRAADWESALDHVAWRLGAIIARHGPDSVAFYLSGQMLTEDYYVANKLMKGFIGSANVDTNSRLCMSSTVAGHRRAFGTDTVPGTYEDIDEADLVVLVGSNLAWCHPILHRRLMAARAARGTRIIVIDPRRTASCEDADLHLPIRPGADVALFNRLLAEIAARGATDTGFLAHVEGAEAAIAAARADRADTGLSEAQIRAFCDMWIDTTRVVTIFSQGVNQSSSGTDKVNAIINCHLATGRIGRPGMGPFSVTGQPNAMGGREVGGLANMLACHMALENPAHRTAVARFWNAPAPLPERPGLKAVEMFDAVAEGRIRAIWIIHTNPAATMPDADRVRAALKACELVVVSDITAQTDTAECADVLLPALGWAEKDGTVTNSDRTISRQRPVLPGPRLARADWAILADIGRRLGWRDAFAWDRPAQIFREHAALSGIAGGFGLDFDISGLAGISDAEYDALAPTRWPVSAARRGGRFYGDGRFHHADGRARMVALTSRPPADMPDAERPFVLNTGRARDHWHTMTRTGRSARLSAHMAEPWLDIHPKDAARLGLAAAGLAEVTSATGRAVLRVRLNNGQRRGEVFAPIHWTGQTAPTGRVSALVAGRCDPLSGQPESKATPVAIRPLAARWLAFAVATRPFRPDCAYWALARTAGGWRAELAGTDPVADWPAKARRLFALANADLAESADPARGAWRGALTENGRLVAALFVAPQPVALMRDHITACLGREAPHVLTGMAPADAPDEGPVVCACLGVGVNAIARAIVDGALSSVAQIAAATGAGTNCGSCRAEVAALIDRLSVPRPAAAE